MDITINASFKPDMVAQLPLRELAEFVIAAEGKPTNSEVSISFVEDAEIARLNAEYRGIAGTTDVLSFECDNLDDEFATLASADIPYELGDVVIAVDVCERQAPEYGNTFQEEIELLLTHGLLHLCGYDHIEDDEAEVMEARERDLLAKWRSRA